MELSLLVPAKDERDNIGPLLDYFSSFTETRHLDWEMIIVDDGSTDGTYDELKRITPQYKNVKFYKHRRNLGVTHALKTALRHSNAPVVAFFPADLQFTLEDVEKMLLKLQNEGLDLVAGWKVGKYEKRFVSSVYNTLVRMLFGIKVHDMNSMKIMKREVLKLLPLRTDWHRYIIPWAKELGFKIGEEQVILKPRMHGESKYKGSSRILKGLFDLISVKFLITFRRKPMFFFGGLGLASFILGTVIGIITLYLRIFKHFGYRPLLYLVMFLLISSFLFFLMGFLGELISGLYDLVEGESQLENEEDGADS
ncbi:MAG TPA: glycosyltransferase family 2 protein [Candidatus Hydrothermia bacterium]|nr:glycosyltransferase family 2 protein [Candidatus Hydrothermae bacterium]MDD3648877.1 glycosyltransferase family 2 protein [Candidatus Hydrothermia bacterium]MDD5572735.1 glycosyltransferase family 2 protein [Candidatus Hydrothermia bacterium]HOK23118.1 glycosyltransferase family 2 protein [Candidatus Hydrothermia bacterium]HOL23822.1 glycosyltransferase family 2 protein [Candidatus Hydrothermia bacterium]